MLALDVLRWGRHLDETDVRFAAVPARACGRARDDAAGRALATSCSASTTTSRSARRCSSSGSRRLGQPARDLQDVALRSRAETELARVARDDPSSANRSRASLLRGIFALEEARREPGAAVGLPAPKPVGAPRGDPARSAQRGREVRPRARPAADRERRGRVGRRLVRARRHAGERRRRRQLRQRLLGSAMSLSFLTPAAASSGSSPSPRSPCSCGRAPLEGVGVGARARPARPARRRRAVSPRSCSSACWSRSPPRSRCCSSVRDRDGRIDAEALFVFDMTRSMLARNGRGRRDALRPGPRGREEAACRRFRDVPPARPRSPTGCCRSSSRPRARTCSPRRSTAPLGIERPPPDRSGRGRATALGALTALATQNFFGAAADRRRRRRPHRRRVAAHRPRHAARAAARRPASCPSSSGSGTRTSGSSTPAACPSAATGPIRTAALSSRPLPRPARDACSRRASSAARSTAIRRALGEGPTGPRGRELQSSELAPFVLAAAFLPLGFLLWRRNLR